jgi:hypothetical protein
MAENLLLEGGAMACRGAAHQNGLCRRTEVTMQKSGAEQHGALARAAGFGLQWRCA